jgi:hypothetical protein
MTERDHPFVDLLLDLRNDEHHWQLARMATIRRAKLFVDAGAPVSAVARVLGVSVRTVYRRFGELAAVLDDPAGELAAATAEQAAADQEAAAAWQGGPR